MLLLRDYGTMKPADVLAPAIYYAEHGHPLVERANATIATVEALFRDHWPTSAEVYLPGGKIPETGSLFANKALAETYKRIVKEAESAGGDRERQIERARKTWSQGFVAEAIDRFCRTQELMDVSGTPHRGLLTGDDMARWQASVEAPLTYDYRGYTVCKAPWSQGPVTLQQLALLKGFDLDGMDVTGPGLHPSAGRMLQARLRRPREVLRRPGLRGRAVRDAAVGRLQRRAAQARCPSAPRWNCGRATVEGYGAVVKLKSDAKLVAGLGAGEPTVGRMGEVVGDTVHFDIVDQAGNMVTSTPSGGWLQSSPVIPELGFPLGTRMQMFWLEEGHPAALEPGKRPRTTLSPTMALRDGDAYLAWGSPGGDQQDQWITQFFLRHVHAGMNLQEAIDAPAWHSEHFPISFWPRTARPGVLQIETRVPKATLDELDRRGHIIEPQPEWSEGRLTAASKVGRRRRAAANPRGMQGYAAGR